MKDTRYIFDTYFNGKPAIDDLIKATFAYHLMGSSKGDGAHAFESETSESKCYACGRSREEVRWDTLPAECSSNVTSIDIEGTLASEENKYFALLARADKEVPKLLGNKTLTGELLCKFQNTYGYDPDCVASALKVEIEHLMPEFEKHMEIHKSKSGKFNDKNRK